MIGRKRLATRNDPFPEKSAKCMNLHLPVWGQGTYNCHDLKSLHQTLLSMFVQLQGTNLDTFDEFKSSSIAASKIGELTSAN